MGGWYLKKELLEIKIIMMNIPKEKTPTSLNVKGEKFFPMCSNENSVQYKEMLDLRVKSYIII